MRYTRLLNQSLLLRKSPALYARGPAVNGRLKIAFSDTDRSLALGTVPADISEEAFGDPTKFTEEPGSLAKIQKIIGENVQNCPQFSGEAAASYGKTPFFHIYDYRNPPMPPRIPDVDDILGTVQISKEGIVENTYEPNLMYRMMTRDGFMELSPYLHKKVVQETS